MWKEKKGVPIAGCLFCKKGVYAINTLIAKIRNFAQSTNNLMRSFHTISSLEEMVDLASEDNSITLRAGKF
jgi:hypothetical protein